MAELVGILKPEDIDRLLECARNSRLFTNKVKRNYFY